MRRSLLPSLPRPIALALDALLQEDLPRSADELSDLISVTVEYVAAVALADYLDGATDGSSAADASLNGWLISQLAVGKAQVGQWARWTDLAIHATRSPALVGLGAYAQRQRLSDPASDIAMLLAFRNRVMHGGFVAPLAAIRAARSRMETWLDDLAPLWAMRPLVRLEEPSGPRWADGRGLQAKACEAPSIPRAEWDRPGAVLLVDDANVARLALDPACVVTDDGALELQHAWQESHPRLFERVAIARFYERYQRERRGQIDASSWHEAAVAALPSRGYVVSRAREVDLEAKLAPGKVVRLVGPIGSGRTTLVHALAPRLGRPVAVLPVEPHGVRQDPEVVARWTLQALSTLALGEPAPPDALANDGPTKRRDWFERLAAALASGPAPLLVVDDADLVGKGLYAGESTTACMRHVRRFGATALLVHSPAGTPPEAGDDALELLPLDDDDLAAWGNPSALRERTAGHLEWLAYPDEGRARLRGRIAETAAQPLDRAIVDALAMGPRSANEIAAAVARFTPEVERALRALLDHLVVGSRAGYADVVTHARIGHERSVRVATSERTYALHPAVGLALKELAL